MSCCTYQVEQKAPQKNSILQINLVPISISSSLLPNQPNLYSPRKKFQPNPLRTRIDNKPSITTRSSQKRTWRKEKKASQPNKDQIPIWSLSKVFVWQYNVQRTRGVLPLHPPLFLLSSRTKGPHPFPKQNMLKQNKSPWSRDKNPIARNANPTSTAGGENLFSRIAGEVGSCISCCFSPPQLCCHFYIALFAIYGEGVTLRLSLI